MQTKHGILSKGDLVQLKLVDGNVGVGLALGFVRTASPHVFEFGLVITPYEPFGILWRPTGGQSLVPASAVVGGMPYRLMGGGAVAALLHAS